MNKLLISFALLGALYGSLSYVEAAPANPPKADTNVETRITAQQLTYLADKQRVMFEKNVHVQRPDFELWADKLTVYMKPPQKKTQKQKNASNGLPEGMATGDVDRIVAEHNVRMEREGRSGTCNKATYTMDNGVLLMEGNPRLTDGDNTVTGEVIRYYTNENRSEVLGGAKKRVEAIFSGSKPSGRRTIEKGAGER